MIVLTDLKKVQQEDFFIDALVELTECELDEVHGGIAGAVGGGLGSLAKSAFEIVDVGKTSGSSPFSPIKQAAVVAATAAGVGFTFGGPKGASLKG